MNKLFKTLKDNSSSERLSTKDEAIDYLERESPNDFNYAKLVTDPRFGGLTTRSKIANIRAQNPAPAQKISQKEVNDLLLAAKAYLDKSEKTYYRALFLENGFSEPQMIKFFERTFSNIAKEATKAKVSIQDWSDFVTGIKDYVSEHTQSSQFVPT